MTYPGSGGPWQPNDPNQPGGEGFPAQPGYPQGYPQPGDYQQGAYPQQASYPQGTYPQQAGYPQPGYETGPQPAQQVGYQGMGAYGQPGMGAPRKGRKGPVIGALVAVLVVALGVAGTIFVLNRSGDDAGKANPTEAATNLVNSLSQGDVLGVLQSLTPAESSLLVDFNAKSTQRLKELKVYKQDADPNQMHGASIEAKNLKYDEKHAETVNDHLTITKLIGGTVNLHSDLSELPLTDEFMQAAFPHGLNSQPTNRTVNIADVVKETGEPIRIATVNVDGKWYPSLFYTVADYALRSAHKDWPKTSIANNGASDPQSAVKEMVQAVINRDIRRIIELLPPDEMGALHDAGPVLLDQVRGQPDSGVEVTKLDTDVVDADSGGQKVTLKDLELTQDGETIEVVKDGDCLEATNDGENQRTCADQLGAQMAGEDASPERTQAMTDLASGLINNTGVVTTEVDGKWYVSPLRTYTELGLSAISKLTPDDVLALVKSA